jgi:hypothetical protein
MALPIGPPGDDLSDRAPPGQRVAQVEVIQPETCEGGCKLPPNQLPRLDVVKVESSLARQHAERSDEPLQVPVIRDHSTLRRVIFCIAIGEGA